MKLSKGLFLAFAGLGLFACSNEDVNEGGGVVNGPATVNVQLSLPRIIADSGSRSGDDGLDPQDPVSGTTGSTTPVVVNKVRVVLHAAKGGDEINVNLPGTNSNNEINFTDIKFEGVVSPQSIEVFINETGEEDITTGKLTIDRINTAGLAAPLYAKVLATDNDDTDGCSFTLDSNKADTYNAHITPAPRYARLELSNITHDMNHSDAGCRFKQGTLLGVYLNDLQTAESGGAHTSVTWGEVHTDTYPSPTWSEADNEDNSWVKSGTVWPKGGNCYAYSVFNKPQTVVAMNNVVLNEGFLQAGWDQDSNDVWYAVITKYVVSNASGLTSEDRTKYGINEEGEITVFKAGNIYKITNIAIPDAAWTLGDGENPPTPPTDVTVIAKVTVLPWTIVEGTVSWN